MMLRQARGMGLRRLLCRIAGHGLYAVSSRWHEQRFHGIWPSFHDNAAVACMTCGYVRETFYSSPGAALGYLQHEPVWLPRKLRYGPTCPLCQMQTRDVVWRRCAACGVTDEELFRA